MAVPAIDQIEKVFGPLVDHPIWAAARSYTGTGSAKAPLDPRTGFMAKTNDPSTWGTLGEVLSFNRKHLGGTGAIGIMAGPHPILNPERAAHRPHITAIDIDNGFHDGVPTDWARIALNQLSGETYVEISGSRTGAHAFGIVDSIPFEYLEANTYGTSYYPPNAEKADPNGKRPAIEVAFDKRYMLLTGYVIGDVRPIRNITSRIPLLLPRKRAEPLPSTLLAPPSPDPDGDVSGADIDLVYRTGLTVEERNRVDAMLARYEDLREALLGDKWLDRSAALFASADLAKGYGMTLGQYVSTLMVSTGSAAAHVNDQKDPLRAVARAWNRSPEPERMTSVPAVVESDNDLTPLAPSADAANLLSMLEEKNPLGPPQFPPPNLLEMDFPSRKFILTDMLPAAPIVLAGAGGQGKSTLVITLAVMGLLGIPVWSKRWNDLGRVVYCTKEDEPDDVWKRLKDILHSLNVTKRQYVDFIENRFIIEDLTGKTSTTLVAADRSGTMQETHFVESLIDKYRNLDVGLMIFDPINQFGPGESHGNDGAAAVLQVGWKLSRNLRAHPEDPAPKAKSAVLFISHMSMAGARDEVDDLHAGRSAAAFGDNARAVFVLHRHKVDNPRGHVAPPSIPREAIDMGRVLRFHNAKQSYAANDYVPLYIERQGWGFTFHEPMTVAQAAELKQAQPTPAIARKQAEFEEGRAQLRNLILTMSKPFTAGDVKSRVAATVGTGHTRWASAVPGELGILVDEGKLTCKGDVYTVVRPEVSF